LPIRLHGILIALLSLTGQTAAWSTKEGNMPKRTIIALAMSLIGVGISNAAPVCRVVGNTGGSGIVVKSSPSIFANTVDTLFPGVRVNYHGDTTDAGGVVWAEITGRWSGFGYTMDGRSLYPCKRGFRDPDVPIPLKK
jgi:hypothetical protein